MNTIINDIIAMKDTDRFYTKKLRIRQDSDDFYLAVNYDTRSYYCINRTMCFILSIFLEVKSFHEVFDMFKNRYPDLPSETLGLDIKHSIITAMRYGLLEAYKEENE